MECRVNIVRHPNGGHPPVPGPQLLVQLAGLQREGPQHQVGLVQRQELLQEALHGPRQLRDPAGVGLGQGLHGR